MKTVIGNSTSKDSNRARRPGGRLRIQMNAEASWIVPIVLSAVQAAPQSRLPRSTPQRVEISLMRAVTQSALRSTANHWGR